MLFVGSNVHCWWYRTPDIFCPIFYNNTYRDAARILHWAHTRTSTKEHDHVFALANAFPEVMKEITIDYKQDFQKLIIQFYCALARHDLSILCFKNHTQYRKLCKTSSSNSIKEDNANESSYEVPIQKFDLPSWTGVYGEHYEHNGYNTTFKNFTFNGRVMQVTCSGMTNNQHHAEVSALASIGAKDIPPIPQQKTNGRSGWSLITRVRPPGSRSDKCIEIYNARWGVTELNFQAKEEIIEHLRNLSHFIPIQKPNFEWIHESSPLLIKSIYLHELTETLEESASYVLLNGIQFTGFNFKYLHPRYPVVKKDGDYYKLIGMCMIKGADDFMDDITLEEQMFEIH
ncbi:hypothetical protein INT45_009836 [Circinella minor]|uniref:Uncharacterized protein n=1 Tax=Circinella minor TaxID=1195481 RepID=A0A8H7S5A2_9FUNG|nr:hypothetical protein INT45_009836 [Circinella minor]